MKAIILAAGVGQRLGEISGGMPKSLLQFDGVSLLHRHISILEKLGIEEVLVVTGYKKEEISTALSGIRSSIVIDTVYNPDFESGSVISLYAAQAILETADEFLLMDADVLYHPDILQTLHNSTHRNCFLLDRDFEAGDEPVKICVRDGIMVDFRKQIEDQLQYEYQGESVGFFKFSGDVGKKIAGRCKLYIENSMSEAPYEEILRDLLLEEPGMFGFEDISGLPWIEIDFPEDVTRASDDILSQIPTWK